MHPQVDMFGGAGDEPPLGSVAVAETGRLHRIGLATELLAEDVFAFVRSTLAEPDRDLRPAPAVADLELLSREAITGNGIGADRAFTILTELLTQQCLPVANRKALAFVGHAPAPAAILADIAVSAASVFADWWLEGAGAIHAENQALRWLADLAGFPEGAGGVFLNGGTVANLTALHVARHNWLLRRGRTGRLAIAATGEAHSSVRLAARVLDVEVVAVPCDDRDRMSAGNLARALEQTDLEVFAVVASAGCTNSGAIDDLAGLAEICHRHGIWMHVDGAYGAAALASPRERGRFAGIERADSLVIDPHKWLFAPADCSALLYRDPAAARRANSQSADYLDVVEDGSAWNPSDFGIHMTRRARGLPLWFALAAQGVESFAEAIDTCLRTAGAAARLIERTPGLELVTEPGLSVVLFRRIGWNRARYESWSRSVLERGLGLVEPTSHKGEPVLRLCFVNPRTTIDDVAAILDTFESTVF